MGLDVKNPLRAQSKYGLVGSSAKNRKIFYWRVTGVKKLYFFGSKT